MRSDGGTVITSAQLRAARALLGIDQRQLAGLVGVSVPTIQRMEASPHVIRGNVDSLMRLLRALDGAGIELIDEGATSETGGRGVRLKAPPPRNAAEEAESASGAGDQS
ncbi:MAG: helix-turn-helix transcriptional regulator [Rhizobiaceae bacterium]|nr:helix-turn-helix transcriptional regulator [Rhizobiaceae bacterium]